MGCLLQNMLRKNCLEFNNKDTCAPDEPERRDFDQACDGIESAVDSALGNPCYLLHRRRVVALGGHPRRHCAGVAYIAGACHLVGDDGAMTEITYHLRQISRHYDGVWRMIDQRRQDRRADDPSWPAHVYLPLERGIQTIIDWHSVHLPGELNKASVLEMAHVLCGMAAWRITLGVYRYDADMYAHLIDTPVTGQLPGELLTRLPEWCIYIETPGLTTPAAGGGEVLVHGVWTWLDRRQRELDDVLTIMLHTDSPHVPPITHVYLVGSIEDAIETTLSHWRSAVALGNTETLPPKGYADAARQTLPKILSLLLYLCSDEPDIADRIHPGERPGHPRPKRTKLGWRLFAADKPRLWTVGESLGDSLRQSGIVAAETTRRTVAAHIRRAHWHGFWSGPKDGDRVFRVKWLPPMVVGGQ